MLSEYCLHLMGHASKSEIDFQRLGHNEAHAQRTAYTLRVPAAGDAWRWPAKWKAEVMWHMISLTK
jgi:hypothetical protein